MDGSRTYLLAWRSVLLVLALVALAGASCINVYGSKTVGQGIADPRNGPVGESAPKTVGQAEFQAVADRVWKVPPPNATTEVHLALRATNRRTGDIRFPREFLRVTLTMPDGTPLVRDGGSNALKPPPVPSPPVKPGGSTTIPRPAQLAWRKDGQRLRLIGSDELGGVWYFDGLRPGKYLLRLEYEAAPTEALQGTPVWSGKVETSALKVEIR